MYICNCLFLTELTSKTDVQTLTGKTLSVTAGTASPGPAPSTDTIACPYVNLLLCNAQPAGERSSHRNWIYVHNTLFSLLKINLRLANVLFERNIEKIFFVLFCFCPLYICIYIRDWTSFKWKVWHWFCSRPNFLHWGFKHWFIYLFIYSVLVPAQPLKLAYHQN